ncbi:hypothetical protein HWV62_25846 [Athelia sp. TMB]|nr:hypothetical protein HWV62_28366 [Athelia sp. TMB]KAF7969848.1 hypothetical protein HWV62_25846 [Athelia sp. TMB]
MNFGPLNSPSPQLPRRKANLIRSLPPSVCPTPHAMQSAATSRSGSGDPSSSSYTDFFPLQYPHDVLSQDNTRTNSACNNAALTPSPIFDAPDMSASDFFADHVEFPHPGTPSSASSGSGLMTPIYARGVAQNPAIASGDDEEAVGRSGERRIGGQELTATPPEKSDAEEPVVDWPQLLAALYIDNPDAARWFAQTRPRSAPAAASSSSPQDDRGVLLQLDEEPSSLLSPLIYPQEHSDTLAEFLASLDDPTSFLSPAFAAAALDDPSSDATPLHQPQPVRPIPQIKLHELAAAALRLGRPRVHWPQSNPHFVGGEELVR